MLEENNTIVEETETVNTELVNDSYEQSNESKDSNAKKIAIGTGIVAGAAGLITGAIIFGKKLWKKIKDKKTNTAKTEEVEAEVVNNQ